MKKIITKLLGYTSMALVLSLMAGCMSQGGTGKQAKSPEKQNEQPSSTNQDVKEEAEGDPALSLEGLEMKGTINVSTYDTDEYLEAAAKAFEAKYPDVHINIDVFAPSKVETMADGSVLSTSNDDPNLSVDKYVAQLNTAFMNGTASDMINFMGLPFYKYADKGYLYDFKNTINGSDGLSGDEYYLNVLEAAQYNEGYYNMPFMFNAKTLGVVKPILDEAGMKPSDLTNETWNLESMLDFAKKVEEKTGKKYGLNFRDGAAMFAETLSIGGNPCVDLANKKVNFDCDAFKKLLEQVKEGVDEGYIKGYDGGNTLFCDNVSLNETFFDDHYFTPSWDDYCIAWKPYTNSEGAIDAMLYCNYGLNAASNQKALCWAFMKFLYSEEMQSDVSCYGRRMNKAAEKKRMTAELDFSDLPADMSVQLKGSKEEALKEYLDFDDQCIQLVKGCDLLDFNVRELIWKEATPYFKGEKTADEVAQTLQNKINVMFNE